MRHDEDTERMFDFNDYPYDFYEDKMKDRAFLKEEFARETRFSDMDDYDPDKIRRIPMGHEDDGDY